MTPQTSSTEPSLLAAIWRYKFVFGFTLAVAVVTSLLLGRLSATTYGAEAVLVVEDPSSQTVFGADGVVTDPARYASDQQVILESNQTAAAAAEKINAEHDTGLTAADVLAGRTVVLDDVSGKITVSYEAPSEVVAVDGANAILDAYLEVRQQTKQADSDEQQELLQSKIDSLNGQISTLTAQIRSEFNTSVTINQTPEYEQLVAQRDELIGRVSEYEQLRDELDLEAQQTNTGITLYDRAVTAEAGGGSARLAIVALVLGAVVGAATAYALALRRRRFEDRGGPEAVLGAPLLADVPDFSFEKIRSRLPVVSAPRTAAAESFRFAAASLNIERLSATGRGSSFVVTSATLSEGKSTVVANTGIALARHGTNVVLVDADFETRDLSRLLLSEPEVAGMADVVEGRSTLDEALHTVTMVEGGTVTVLPPGFRTSSAHEFLESVQARDIFRQLAERFEVVLVDCPPLLQVAYSAIVASYVDSAVVVVGHLTSAARASEVVDRLRFAGTPIVGYVYNKAPLRPELSAYHAHSSNLRLESDSLAEEVRVNGNGSGSPETAQPGSSAGR